MSVSCFQVKAFAVPPPASVSAVTDWLNENGITDITTSGAFGEWLGFSLTIANANSLFDANFQQFTEVGGPTQLTRTLAYSLPADLQQHINLVHPTTVFARKLSTGPMFKALNSNNNTSIGATTPASCNSAVTPTCVQVKHVESPAYEYWLMIGVGFVWNTFDSSY